MNEKLILILEHSPAEGIKNGYHSSPVDPGEVKHVEVESLDDGIVRFCEYIGRNGLSGRNLTENSGLVLDSNGQAFRKIRFNGTIEELEAESVEMEKAS